MNNQVRHSAPRVKLVPNISKTIDAIRFLVAEAKRRGKHVSQYDILKSLFLADRSHLNRCGRPVTYDNYFAMRDGPVASLAYNILKQDPKTLVEHDIHDLPWRRVGPQTGSGRFYYEDAKEVEEDGETLSPSDASALADALTVVISMSFTQIRKLTHDDPAYVEAWRDNGPKRFHMSYGMLFDSPDYDMAERVKALSEMA
jgi:uncharacterized phage-associated protein